MLFILIDRFNNDSWVLLVNIKYTSTQMRLNFSQGKKIEKLKRKKKGKIDNRRIFFFKNVL